MSKGAAKAAGEQPGFDESLERLEAIVAELEQGGEGLESSLERYREGVALLKGCRERLGSFRAQVEELSADGVRPSAQDPDVAPVVPSGEKPQARPRGPRSVDPPRVGGLEDLDTPF